MFESASRLALGVSFALLTLVSCGGGSGGGSASLEGTWYGAGFSSDGFPVTVRMFVDGDDEITEIEIDVEGNVKSATGSIDQVASQICEFVLSNGNTGGLVLDKAREHAIVLDKTGGWQWIVVLERGAVDLPAYAESDVYDKTYGGLTVYRDASFGIDETVGTEMTVFADGTFSGFDGGGTTFSSSQGTTLDLIDPVCGVWRGSYEADGPGGPSSGQGYVLLSCDKTFVGVVIREQGAPILESGFGAWPEK
jgi:hypothetical protein